MNPALVTALAPVIIGAITQLGPLVVPYLNDLSSHNQTAANLINLGLLVWSGFNPAIHKAAGQ